jgi:hypothetical protein
LWRIFPQSKERDMKITDFLVKAPADFTPEELGCALKVLRAFKECESESEWAMAPFAAWTKLEQLEEFLAHIVDGEPLKEDTVRYQNS